MHGSAEWTATANEKTRRHGQSCPCPGFESSAPRGLRCVCDPFVLALIGPHRRTAWVEPAGRPAMMTLALVQVAATPAWVGPTMAISLAVIALSVLGASIALAVAVMRLSGQVRKVSTVVEGLQDDVTEG